MSYKNGYVEVHGRFKPNGSSSITNNTTNCKGFGWTVARTNTGYFTVTFTDYCEEIISFLPFASFVNATARDQVIQGGALSASSKTAIIYCYDISGAGVADITADADNWVHFIAVLKMSNS
jgi:hypothetical protein